MENDKQHIDDLFKSGLDGLAETPPPAVWSALEKRLDNKKNRRVFFWPWFVFVGIMIASLGILLAGKMITPKISNKDLSKNNIQHKQPEHTNNKVEKANSSAPILKENKETESHKTAPIHIRNRKTVHTIVNNAPDKKEIITPDEETAYTENTVKANVIPDIVMEDEITTKGHIRVEQAVIKKQAIGSPALSSDNAVISECGNSKTRGIVVVALPDAPKTYSQTQPMAIVQHTSINTPFYKKLQPLAIQHALKVHTTVQPSIIVQRAPVTTLPHKTLQSLVTQKTVANVNNQKSKLEKPRDTLLKKNNLRYAVALSKKPHATKSINVINAGMHTQKTAKHLHINDTTSNKPVAKTVHANTPLPAKKNPLAISNKKAGKKITTVKKAVVASGITNHVSQKTPQNTASKKKSIASVQRKKQATKQIATSLAQTGSFIQPIQAAQPVAVLPQQKPTISSNSIVPQSAVAPKTIPENKNSVFVNPDSKPPGTFKADAFPKSAGNTDSSKGGSIMDTATAAQKLRRFEVGIKAGYESGFNSEAARKFVVSPYIQYNINSRFSIMSQPAIKSAYVNSTNLNGSQSFYSKSGGTARLADSVVMGVITNFNPITFDTFIKRNYVYSQIYDSIAKTYKAGGTYLEFQIPILLKYKLIKTLSVYGGITLTYGKQISIAENTYTSTPVIKTGVAQTLAPYSQGAPAPPDINTVIAYSGIPISNYRAPLYPSPLGDLFRVGYMLGVSYELKKRFLIDASLEQSGVSPNVQGGYDVSKPLSSVYFRFTVGYRIIK